MKVPFQNLAVDVAAVQLRFGSTIEYKRLAYRPRFVPQQFFMRKLRALKEIDLAVLSTYRQIVPVKTERCRPCRILNCFEWLLATASRLQQQGQIEQRG